MNEVRARQIMRRSTQSYWINRFEMFRLRTMTPSEVRAGVKVEGLEHLQDAMNDGRGAILTSGHFGAYNMGGARLCQEWPLMALSIPLASGAAQKHIEAARKTVNLRTFPPEGGARISYKALRAQGLICIFVDLPANEQHPQARFLNYTSHMHSNAVQLAMAVGSPIVPVTCVRHKPWISEGSLILKISPPLRLDYKAVKGSEAYEAAIERGTHYGLQVIHTAVRKHPEEWHLWGEAREFFG